MICYYCGRRLKRASATVPGRGEYALGPVCAAKMKRRAMGHGLFKPAFDLDRACAEAMRNLNEWIEHRGREVLIQLKGMP